MGSLVPGWDSRRITAPAPDLQTELDNSLKDKPREGYFARLEKARSQRLTADVATHLETSPGRSSPHRTLQHLATMPAPSPHEPHPHLERFTTGRQPRAATPEYHPTTRWEQELAALKPLGRLSHDTYFTAQRPSAHQQGDMSVPGGTKGVGIPSAARPQSAWWSSLDTAALNAHPDLPEDSADARNAPFQPQFDMTRR